MEDGLYAIKVTGAALEKMRKETNAALIEAGIDVASLERAWEQYDEDEESNRA